MGAKDVDAYARKAPVDIRIMLQDYLKRLRIRPAGNNAEGVITDSTAYEHLSSIKPVLIKYYEQEELEKKKKKLNLEEISIEFIINLYVNQQKRRSKYDRYYLFLVYRKEKGLIKKEYAENFKERMNEYKNFHKKITEPSKIKKWSVPEKRWKEIYRLCLTNPLRFACWLGFNFGLRVGEICHLKLENIILNAEGGDIYIQADPTRKWTPKTVNSIRTIPLAKAHVKVIENYLKTREEFIQANLIQKEKTAHNYLIYSTWNSLPVVEDTLRDWMEEIEIEFEEKGRQFNRTLRPHVCRYSFAVNFYYKTLNIHRLSSLLGHSSIRETERYLALSKDQAYQESKILMKEVYDNKNEKIKIEDLYQKLESEIIKLDLFSKDKENKYGPVMGEIINNLQEIKVDLLKV